MHDGALLSVEALSAWYGPARALRDVTMEVQRGETVTLVGRNGAGKSTMLRSLMGMHTQVKGRIRFDGAEIGRLSSFQRARRGMGYVPDDRGIYARLTVERGDEEALGAVRLGQPYVPVVDNVTAAALTDPDEIKRRLVEQVTGLVRWRESVLYMKQQGVDTLVELGAGRVLSGLAKRIDRELATSSLGAPAEIETFLKTL